MLSFNNEIIELRTILRQFFDCAIANVSAIANVIMHTLDNTISDDVCSQVFVVLNELSE